MVTTYGMEATANSRASHRNLLEGEGECIRIRNHSLEMES